MPTYRKKSMLGGTLPVAPSFGNQLTGQPATRHAIHQVLKPQDQIIGSGRRVLVEAGLRGGGRFTCRNGVAFDSQNGGADIAYADGITYRVVLRTPPIPVTPGSALRMRVVAEPSGKHHGDLDSLSTPPDGGAGGWVKLTAQWDNQTTTTTETAEVFIPGSEESNNGEPDGSGESWFNLDRYSRILRPDGFDFIAKPATNAKWAQPDIEVTLTLEYKGSPRVWDLVVYEAPQLIVYDDEETGAWVFHGYPEQSYPFPYPVKAAEDSGDLTRGQRHLPRVLEGLRDTLGPCLFHWHAGSEHENEIEDWVDYGPPYGGAAMGTTGDDEAPAYTGTGTTKTLLWESSLSSWAATNPGPAMGCGAYGRTAKYNGDRGYFGLRGRGGVIPVYCAFYGKASSGDETTVRFQTRPHSWVDVVRASTSDGWQVQEGYLSVGRGPEDDLVCSAFAYGSDGSATWSVRDAIVFHRRR